MHRLHDVRVMCPDTAIEVYRSMADKQRQEETPA